MFNIYFDAPKFSRFLDNFLNLISKGFPIFNKFLENARSKDVAQRRLSTISNRELKGERMIRNSSHTIKSKHDQPFNKSLANICDTKYWLIRVNYVPVDDRINLNVHIILNDDERNMTLLKEIPFWEVFFYYVVKCIYIPLS